MVTILITHVRGLIALLVTTHEPPSTLQGILKGTLKGEETFLKFQEALSESRDPTATLEGTLKNSGPS